MSASLLLYFKLIGAYVVKSLLKYYYIKVKNTLNMLPLPSSCREMGSGFCTVTRRLEKNRQIFQRIAQKVTKSKKAKIFTTKFNLKVQNIYIKPIFKPKNTYNKPSFETAYLGKNVINLLKQKVAQKVKITFGYFIFLKDHNEPPKVAQSAKKSPNLVTLAFCFF